MIRLLALEKPTPDYVHTVYVLCVHHERDSCSRASQCQSLFCRVLPAIPAHRARSQTDGLAEKSMTTRCSYYVVGWQSRARRAGRNRIPSAPAEADETPNRIEVIFPERRVRALVNVNVDVGSGRTALGRSYHGRGLDGCSYLPRVAELRTVRSMAYPEIHPNQESSD